MSELINTNDNRATIRWKLLTSASALAFTAYVSSANVAKAEDSDRPTLWIELGGQMDMMQGLSSPFTAPFMFKMPDAPVYQGGSFTGDQRPARFPFGADGKITFQPEDSDWLFSASIRYGRSHSKNHVHHQLSNPPFTSSICGCSTQFNSIEPVFDVTAPSSERHMLLDFTAGRDVGIGVFGHDGTSSINAGVRMLDVKIGSTISAFGRPEVNVALKPPKYELHALTFPYQYTMTAHAERSFRGVGPTLSWNASAGLAGNKESTELMLDWGVNVALLFGRQKAKTDHTTQAYSSQFIPGSKYKTYVQLYHHGRYHSTRSRSVTVPNVGGFAGLSLKWTNAKVSVGYRVDTFLGAMDTGIDTAKKSNLTFNGPYASISVGIGD